jgi:hypothetical protein
MKLLYIVKGLLAFFIVGALVFSCSLGKFDETGCISIQLPGSGSARSLSQAFTSNLRYQIVSTGPGGTQTRNARHGDTVSLNNLTPGNWTVTVTVLSADGVPIGRETKEVTVESGRNTSVNFVVFVHTDGSTSITITGLSDHNGKMLDLFLFASSNIMDYMDIDLGVWGYGEVKDGTATIALFNEHGRPWIPSGSWYLLFMLDDDSYMGGTIWMSNTQHNFNLSLNPSIPFSNFSPMVFSITVGELAAFMDEQIVYTSNTTIDSVLQQLFGMNVSDFELDGILLFRNEQMTVKFGGGDFVTSSATRIYANFPFWWWGDREHRGAKIGEIRGEITLSNIPSGARVYISGFGRSGMYPTTERIWSTWGEDRIRVGISGSSAPDEFSWRIPIYEIDLDDDRGFDPNPALSWYFTFKLYVELPGGNGYELSVPHGQSISFTETGDLYISPHISLGPVSLATVTLSGTINITYNGSAVPWLDINVSTSNDSIPRGSAWRSFATSGTSWWILIPVSDVERDAEMRIYGYQSRQGNRLFDIGPISLEPIPANTGRNNIAINIGNLANRTVRVLNPPSGNYYVYITDLTLGDPNFVQSVIGGSVYLSTWQPLSGYGNYYHVLIVAGTERKLAHWASSFHNGIGLVDWNTMSPLP